ncbi:DNA-binding WRKY [Macleaya cordata]|uniref:DNA-binding WRKY n=1 Tax=Macleaya cordata TaxID=56857 RepID=A0A200Q168_MACCD|nr:DNA-binding WRKY [Macleaya cordata]
MAGTDDHAAVIGDWSFSNPSPRTFFSSILGDDFSSKSFSDVFEEKGSEDPFAASVKHKTVMDSEEENDKEISISGGQFSEASILSVQKSGSRGGLAERMAARAGFNAPKLNTARIRSGNLSSSPEVRSPYLTIPPGLSPTTLLDSPVFLSNSLAQPSPTTGKFSFAPISNNNNNKDNPFEDFDTSSFVFKPHTETSSLFFPGGGNKVPPASNPQESFTNIAIPVQSEQSLQPRNLQADEVLSRSRTSFHQVDLLSSSIEKGNNILSEPKKSNSISGNLENSPPLNGQQDVEGDRANGELNTTVGSGASSEDGYNWRKYGQKQVKGSEYPRSYYKCTHQNCQVKKKVERSHEGHVTEIIYKGAHNHPKPPPHRRSAVGSSNPQSDMQLDLPEHGATDGDPIWASSQRGVNIGGPDMRNDNLETGSSPSLAPEFCNPSTSMQAKIGPHFETADALEVSSTVSNDEDEDDRGTHGSVSLGYDGEGDESESKRRKIDASAMEMSGATRSIREPRVVVQTTSEVDILDDGYRWRKYGQKVVKGNPNPRSYYKCTNAGCTVRKHVERASHDLKSVITTYEGKHNHDVPAARNSSHVNSGLSNAAPTGSGHTHIHRPEPSQIHENISRYDGPTSLGTFNLPGRQQLGPSPGYSFGMNQPSMNNLAMAGLGSNQGKLPVLPIHSYLGQQRQLNEVGFMVPKGEPKEELVSEPSLNLSNGSSLYQQIMSRLPL